MTEWWQTLKSAERRVHSQCDVLGRPWVEARP